MTDHFENTFNLFIKGKPEPKKSKLKQGQDQSNKTEEQKRAEEEALKVERKRIKKGTEMNFTLTLFPETNSDEIVYLKTLHKYGESSNSWFSLSFKPKAKDLKSAAEDLNQMQYLRKLEDYTATIVLDATNIRIGFEGYKLDPFQTKWSEHASSLKEMSTREG